MSPTIPPVRYDQWQLDLIVMLGLDPTKVIEFTIFDDATLEWDEWDGDAKARVRKRRALSADERKRLA